MKWVSKKSLQDQGVHPLPQFQPWLEVNPAVIAKFHWLTSLGIPRRPWSMLPQDEAAEATNFDPIPSGQSLGHVVEDVLHSDFDIGRVDVRIALLQEPDEVGAEHESDRRLLPRHQESAKVADDEGPLGLVHAAFQAIRLAAGQRFKRGFLQTNERGLPAG